MQKMGPVIVAILKFIEKYGVYITIAIVLIGLVIRLAS